MRLQERGCHVVLTNSNHPLVHELYAPFTIDVIQTKRHISCNGNVYDEWSKDWIDIAFDNVIRRWRKE